MPNYAACLIDVYDTILTVDFLAHAAELPALADVDPRRWNTALEELADDVGIGRRTLSDAMTEAIRRSGGTPDDELVKRLLARDRELLHEHCTLYADTMPFLEELKSAGVARAFVSNCAENTRPLLAELGLLDLVDVAVLSCEVGAWKPAPLIYEVALRELDVPASAAMFIDDQPHYCTGARALGITAVRISRKGAEPVDDDATVSSLTELTELL